MAVLADSEAAAGERAGQRSEQEGGRVMRVRGKSGPGQAVASFFSTRAAWNQVRRWVARDPWLALAGQVQGHEMRA